jgi:hypothetical protein
MLVTWHAWHHLGMGIDKHACQHGGFQDVLYTRIGDERPKPMWYMGGPHHTGERLLSSSTLLTKHAIGHRWHTQDHRCPDRHLHWSSDTHGNLLC